MPLNKVIFNLLKHIFSNEFVRKRHMQHYFVLIVNFSLLCISPKAGIDT